MWPTQSVLLKLIASQIHVGVHQKHKVIVDQLLCIWKRICQYVALYSLHVPTHLWWQDYHGTSCTAAVTDKHSVHAKLLESKHHCTHVHMCGYNPHKETSLQRHGNHKRYTSSCTLCADVGSYICIIEGVSLYLWGQSLTYLPLPQAIYCTLWRIITRFFIERCAFL